MIHRAFCKLSRVLRRCSPIEPCAANAIMEDPYESSELASHRESWIEPHKLGSIIPPYRPTYPFEGFINENHVRFVSCPVRDGILVDIGIPGWLRREDALKLYELA